ncbi:MAG: mechanosensitive ion channel family protein [Actinomycetota bacterium]
MNEWIAAAIAVAGGVVIGSLLARIARGVLTKESRPDAVQRSAGAIASLFFSVAVIIGLITALGFVNEAALDQLPEDLVDYVPRALSAAIVLIVANIASTFIVAALERSMGHVSPGIRRRVPPLVRGAILFAGGLIAANQLGIDTTILTLAAAALFFSVALTVALVAYSGSGPVSSEIAASRALRRVVNVGDRIDTDVATGTVVELHGVKVEVETADGRRVLVSYSTLLDAVVGIERAEPAED